MCERLPSFAGNTSIPSRSFLFCRTAISGPDFGAFWCTVFLILLPVALTSALLVPEAVEPEVLAGGLPLSILFLFGCIITFSSLVVAAFSDPGILPRAHSISESAQTPQSVVGDLPPMPFTPPVKPVKVRFRSERLSYCTTCSIYRPPRSSHCNVCNNCVMNFDHHCPWIGNCVGKGNYRYFLWFVNSSVLTCLSGMALGIYLAVVSDMFILFPVGLIVYSVIMCISVGQLVGYHCYLPCLAVTTREHWKSFYFSPRDNPYFVSPCKNWRKVYCGIRWPRFALRRLKEYDPPYNVAKI